MATPFAEEDGISRAYESVTNVFGDIYTETIVLKFSYLWPFGINNSTGGEFSSKLSIESNSTSVKTWDGEVYKLNSSSLYVKDASFRMAMPTGEFINYIQPIYSASSTSGGTIGLDFSVGIPNTPFSITATLPKHIDITSNGIEDFTGYLGTNEYARGVESSFPGRLENSSHFYRAICKVDTHLNYQVLGKKSIQTQWDFLVLSSGNCNGTGVNSYYRADRCSKSLVYELISFSR